MNILNNNINDNFKIRFNTSKFIDKIKFFALILVLSFMSFDISKSQEEEQDIVMPLNIGIYLGGNMNMHNPNFSNLSPFDTTRNILFDNSANSFGLNIGAIFNVPINNTFTFSGRIGYNGMSADLEANNLFTDTTSISTINSSLSYLEISPMMQFHNLLPIKRLYFLAGLELGIPISSTYDKTTTISTPSVTTVTNTTTGNEITDAGIRAALGLGLGYTFDLSEKIYLSPELSFRLPFTNVSSASQFDSWSAPQLRLGVNLTFGFGSDEEVAQIEESDEFKINNVSTYTTDQNGNKVKVDKIVIEDVQYSELFPLVPMVFFDLNESVPSKKTNTLNQSTEAGEFSVDNLEADAVAINNSVLDIIGQRMVNNPQAYLNIIGTNDGVKEKNSKDLSSKRAEFVKNYLMKNFNISADRLRVSSQNLPAKPSSSKDPDGIEENRRVEFSSNLSEIMAPIMIQKDKQTFATPLFVEFEADITADKEIDSWELNIEQSDKTLNNMTGKGNPTNMVWNLKPNELKANEIPIDYTLNIKSTNGKQSKKIGTIPVEYYSYNRKKSEERPDKIISKYSLIVFDFDSPEISQFDKDIIDKNIIPAIKNNSIVQIYGYSDRIGDEKYNQKLSMQRAMKVKEYLSEQNKSAKFETFGLGENIRIYDNDLTVGRQLSRTVQIYVITPKQ